MKGPRVLLVEDSRFTRQMITDRFESAGIRVVAEAGDGVEAMGLLSDEMDVIVLDIKMPRMDGLTFLDYVMHVSPRPVVVMSGSGRRSDVLAMKSLALGAVEFVPKTSGSVRRGGAVTRRFLDELTGKVRSACSARVTRRSKVPARVLEMWRDVHEGEGEVWCLVMAASTGGPSAVEYVVSSLPRCIPAFVLAVLHMPPAFTRMYAERLDAHCSLDVLEATSGTRPRSGRVYVAPGGRHLSIDRSGHVPVLRTRAGKPVNSVVPSADVTMGSVAECFGRRSIGVVLTGMGRDGAQGLLAIREHGGRTIVQERKSALLPTMPQSAIDLGAPEEEVPLQDIPERLLKMLARGGRQG